MRVHCLALGEVDLTSSAGTMTMNVLNAVAQFERDLLIERTQAGLKRAKEAGKKLGRPSSQSDEEKAGRVECPGSRRKCFCGRQAMGHQ